MSSVQRSLTSFGLGIAALALVCAPGRAATSASVAGVVRDTQGAAQAGAMVQVLTGSSAIATAFTDIYGRYRIGNLAPGRYLVRASAAMFLPATRPNLRLATGMRATVNLTIDMLADPAVWLPAERRPPGEPSDDWTWTLRSAPDRPILRILGEGPVVMAGAGDSEGGVSTGSAHLAAAMTGGDAGFGDGGEHSVIALDRVGANGSDIVLQADLGLHQRESSTGGSQEISAGYERKGAFGDASRIVLTYASHPELQTGPGGGGTQWMRLASAEKMRLGDLAEVEAGGTVYAIHANGYAVSTRPFLRVTVHSGQVWAVRYRLATSRDVQDFDAMDVSGEDAPVAAMVDGRLTTDRGAHQEIAVTRKAGSGVARMVFYRDSIARPAISGTGAAGYEEMAGLPAVMDAATGDFQLPGAGYSSNGASIAVAEPLGAGLWGSLEYASGSGLAAAADHQTLASAAAALHPISAGATTAALQGSVGCAHTKLRASYRWQPHEVVTPVDAYAAGSNQPYLSFYIRQAISLGSLLPQGLEATIDVTNLLAEGYHPFLSADGRTLYLAQAPRTVTAGLAFNF